MKFAKKNHAWAPEEDAALTIAWADVTLSTAAIGAAMQRTTASLYPRAVKLRLPSRPLGVPTANSSFWTKARLEVLRAEFDARTGFTAIGRKLGCTKNMALGKCNRMGWTRAAQAWTPTQARTERGLKAAANGHRVTRLTNSVARPKARLTIVGNNTVIEHPQRPPLVLTRADVWNPLPDSKPRPFETRRFTECNWPIDDADGSPMLRCCLPVERGGYCSTHRVIARAPRQPRDAKPGQLARSLRRYA